MIFYFPSSVAVSQTKDALFTILRDLRPGDNFNFVSFSNKIKVWQPNRLVPVTPLNIRDAKKFIYMLAPTGGETLFSMVRLCLVFLKTWSKSSLITAVSFFAEKEMLL